MNVTGHKRHSVFCAEYFLRTEVWSQQNRKSTSRLSIPIIRAKKLQLEKAGIFSKLGFAFPQKLFLEASYKIAYRISKQKKLHIIVDTLGKPRSLEMVEFICGLE
jgi:hypothetical protein